MQVESATENSASGMISKIASLEKLGYCLFDFSDLACLKELISLVEQALPRPIPQFHESNLSIDAQVELILEITNRVAESNLVTKLLFKERAFFTSLLGPDIDVQAKPHLRLSRPNANSEMIGWHRDSFYGNSPLEMNIWFPLAELKPGSGLALVSGSHVVPSVNIRTIEETDDFKKTITRGSSANKIGFQYSPKTDDSIAGLNHQTVHLVQPKLGQAIFFFGCMIHKAQNTSSVSRASIDARIKHPFTPTETKNEYYKPLCRGLIAECAKAFEGPQSR